MEDESFRKFKEALTKHSRREIDQENWNALEQNIFFHGGGYHESIASDFGGKDQLKRNCKPSQCLFYISTPPGVFEPILENLGESGLGRGSSTEYASKVIIEKPLEKTYKVPANSIW